MAKTDYVNGSDLLLYVDGVAIGHCTTHKTTFSSETKERAVKPAASKSISAGLWKNKGITGLSYSISAEGFRFYGETEAGFKTLFAKWKAAESVTVKCMEREETAPYLVGACIIAQLDEEAGAQEDATYSISLENDGEPDTFDESAITGSDEEGGSDDEDTGTTE